MLGSVAPVVFPPPTVRQVQLPNPVSKKDAYRLFLESSVPNRKFNVIDLIDQRNPFGEGWQRVKVVRSDSGFVFKFVLSPIQMQGIQSVDDGQTWKTLLPDERVVMTERSPQTSPKSLARKAELAKKNYQFSVSGMVSVAGRDCFQVQIRPHCTELATWTLYLDRDTAYPLRMDTSNEGDRRVEFISRAVSFPSRIDPGLLTLRVPVGYHTVNYECPESLPSPKSASRALGFAPCMPGKLPFGFQVQDLQISHESSWKSLVVRLTDGLARASVYEFVPSEGTAGVKPLENSSVATVGAIRLMLVSDISKDCREQLLLCFGKSSRNAKIDLLSKP